MEIRRVDKELIQPAAASEAGSKVDVDRRPQNKNQQSENKREDDNNEELTSEELAKLTIYNPEGHVSEKIDTTQIKHINFKA
jgi:hemolysin activation/secretion protein